MCTGVQIFPDKNEFTCDMQNSRDLTCNEEESRELANSPRAEKRRVVYCCLLAFCALSVLA